MKRIKKKHVVTGTAVLLIIIFFIRVFIVRSRFPQIKIEEYRRQETTVFEPEMKSFTAWTELSPADYHVYTGGEFIEEYPEVHDVYDTYKNFDSYYVYVPEIIIKNTGDKSVSVNRLTSFFQYVNPYDGYTNGLYPIENIILQPGEEDTAKFVVLVHPDVVGEGKMEKFLDSDFFIVVMSYPVEKRLVYEKE